MSDMNTEGAQTTQAEGSMNPRVRWFWIVLSLLVLAGVVYFLSALEDTIDVAETASALPPRLVSVETVVTAPQTVELSAFAEVRPRWSAELRSAVSGRVTKVESSALAGEPVEAGTTLIEIENSRFIAELASAELALKQAKLGLWRAENATLIARNEFKRTGREPPNDLALKLPQLDIAESTVKSAGARILAVRKQLDDTRIDAPFSGFVTQRFVSPGQIINVGDQLIKLVDNTALELEVELGRKAWTLLQKPLAGMKAQVLDQGGGLLAEARIRRGGGFLDETTRQYKVFLAINDSSAKNVLSGDFVKVLLPGVTVPKALDIPASALTQEGYVWHVDAQDRLQRIEPDVLFRRQDRVIVGVAEGKEKWRVAVTPLASFLPGQKVQTQAWGS